VRTEVDARQSDLLELPRVPEKLFTGRVLAGQKGERRDGQRPAVLSDDDDIRVLTFGMVDVARSVGRMNRRWRR
jgi:hypothetical protein